jgi:orotate phosphoribosyltransferase
MNRLLELARKSIIYETIKRKSGGVCNYYVDGKRLVLHPEFLYLAAEKILEYAYTKKVSHVGGEIASAIPLVGAVTILSHVHKRPIKGFMIRQELKSYGKSDLIEGELPKESRALLIDDVTGLGTTAERCCNLLQSRGINIAGYVSIIDRNEAARIKIEKLGVEYTCLINIEQLTKVQPC